MADSNGNGKPAAEQQKRALVPINMVGGALMPANLQEAIEYAKLIAHSGMVPKNYDGNVGAVLVAIQMGQEVGLPPLAALQTIAVINGRPCLWGDGMLAVVTGHHECIDVVEDFDEKTMTATCTVRRRGRQAVVRVFSQSDAKTANLWGKQGPWSQYPKRMLQMRARGFACRDAFPDALRGIRSGEEVRDYPDSIIDGEIVGETKALSEGTHSFGFAPKTATQEPVKVEAAEPAKQAAPARPLSQKEKDWRAKHPKAESKHDPVTGVVDDVPPSMGGQEEPPVEDWSKVGPPPMSDDEPGSRG